MVVLGGGWGGKPTRQEHEGKRRKICQLFKIYFAVNVKLPVDIKVKGALSFLKKLKENLGKRE